MYIRSTIVAQLLLGLFTTQACALPNPVPTYSVVDVDGGHSGVHVTTTTVFQTITALAPASTTLVTTSPTTVSITITEYATVISTFHSEASSVYLTETVDHTVTLYQTDSAANMDKTITLYQTVAAPTIEQTVTLYQTITAPAIEQTVTLYQTAAATEISTSISTASSNPADYGIWSAQSTASITTPSFTSRLEPTTTESSALSTTSSSLSSTMTYDDGMWHTTYPVRATLTTLSTLVSTTNNGLETASSSLGHETSSTTYLPSTTGSAIASQYRRSNGKH